MSDIDHEAIMRNDRWMTRFVIALLGMVSLAFFAALYYLYTGH